MLLRVVVAGLAIGLTLTATAQQVLEAPQPQLSTPFSVASFSDKSDNPGISSYSSIAVKQYRVEKGIHWKDVLLQSGFVIALQNVGNVSMDKYMRWYLTHGNFFHKWFDSVEAVRWSVWNDNDPFLDDYIAHPMQGSLYSLILIQNDPRYRAVRLSKKGEYWKSRLKGLGWSAVLSVQWKIGPFSEASIGNTGIYPYYSNASHGMTNGTGMVDWFMTPIGGSAWLVGEDAIDRFVVPQLMRVSHRLPWKMAVAVLTPTHSAANIIRFRRPWFREPEPTPPAHIAAGQN